MILFKLNLLIFFAIFLILIFAGFILFYRIFLLEDVSLDLGIKVINIYPSNPRIWFLLKRWFMLSYVFSAFVISISFTPFSLFSNVDSRQFSKKIHFHNNASNKNALNLLVGIDSSTNEKIYIPEKGLYQNILITGTIGTGKTSSAMYPFTKQLINFACSSTTDKLCMLILDVKGNYYHQVQSFAKECRRLNDVIIIELNGKYTYNPLHKPHLKPSVIANQLKEILLLFSPNNNESYWLDKVESILSEAIKFCRLYNDGYVNFQEIHKIICEENYFNKKLKLLKQEFISNNLSQIQLFDLLSCVRFFNDEFFSLDPRTLGILKSEVTRITNCFISDYDVAKTFSPKKEDLNFFGFGNAIDSGKIIVLNMNINEYRNLSKIIAAYLKIDFQTEVMSRLAKRPSSLRQTAFICDEYSEYAGRLDADFFSQSREAKCINILATQSYTSLLNTINNSYAVKVITQNLVNKFWFRTDDIYTIEDAQKQIGKVEKEKSSRTISENAKNTYYNYFTNSFNSKDSNISESINKYSQFDFVYDTNFFTQHLETFCALSFISNGSKILPPRKLNMIPFFK